jgi:DNA polymerase V
MQRLRQRFGVTVARTSLELSGQPCLAVGEEPQPPQSITVSRTFGEPTDQTDDVRAAVAVFLENACAKARLQGVVASHLAIWLVPRELGTGDQSCTIPLRTPTANTCELQEIAGAALVRLCKPGIWYRKAGVGLLGLQADGPIQQDFLDPRDRSRDSRRQAAVDAINALAGKRTVRSATTLLSQEWQPASRLMSRHYTSRWDELMEAR